MNCLAGAIVDEDLAGLNFILYEQPILLDDILECGLTVKEKVIEFGFYEAIMKHLAKRDATNMDTADE